MTMMTLTGLKVPSGAWVQPAWEPLTELAPPHDSMASERSLDCYDVSSVLSRVSSEKTFRARAEGATTRSLPAASAPSIQLLAGSASANWQTEGK